jgi:lipopolysaccharide assembly protein A
MEEVTMTDPYAGQPGPGAPYPGVPQPGPGAPAGRPKRRVNARLIVGGVLLILLIVFAVENTRSVTMRLIGPEVHAPLFLALLIAAVVGVLIGLVIRRRRKPRV